MLFIGDVHTKHDLYLNIVKDYSCSIQLGDFGIMSCFDYPKEPSNHKFLHGNHDDPQLCVTHPNYLGRFGYLKDNDIYYVSGAWSFDAFTKYKWPDNELRYHEFETVIQEVKLYQPSIIASHDCPNQIRHELFGFDKFFNTKTDEWFNIIFNEWQPKYWVFGHYHRRADKVIQNTRFVCLQKLQTIELAS